MAQAWVVLLATLYCGRSYHIDIDTTIPAIDIDTTIPAIHVLMHFFSERCACTR